MKNEYFIEISCKIDKLMWMFCKSDGVKQKKQVFYFFFIFLYVKQTEFFRRADVVALKVKKKTANFVSYNNRSLLSNEKCHCVQWETKKRKAVPNLLTSGNTPLLLHYKIAMLFEKTYQLFKLLNCKLLCNLRGEKSSSLYMQISFSSSSFFFLVNNFFFFVIIYRQSL